MDPSYGLYSLGIDLAGRFSMACLLKPVSQSRVPIGARSGEGCGLLADG